MTIQILWLSRWWTSLIQWRLCEHTHILGGSESTHFSSFDCTTSPTHFHRLTTIIIIIHPCNWKLSGIIYTWYDVTKEKVRHLIDYQTAALKAQSSFRLFIDRPATISSELFKDYKFGTKSCLRIYECTSKKNRSPTLYLEESSPNMSENG